jgi:DNA-binding MarR family transcriptional regulator
MQARTKQTPVVPAADARALAVTLYDLAWLLPRTIGVAAANADPLPQSEIEVMRLLVRRPGLGVNDVARELGMHSSNVSATIRTLVSRGLLERQRDPADGRGAKLLPTAHAIAMRTRREVSWGRELQAALDAISPADAGALLEAVTSLRALAERLAAPAE